MEAKMDSDYRDDIDDDGPGMQSCLLGDLIIVTNTRSAIALTNKNYPAKYGLYGEIRTKEFAFHFNPTGEIRYIRGLTQSWPHPWEWLKRTWGNDWVYYTVGLERGMGRVKDWMGENYIPCLSYESNAIREINPYTEPGVSTAFSAWSMVYSTLCCTSFKTVPDAIRDFLEQVVEKNNEDALIAQKEMLHRIIGGRVSVLPPDTRHVDYEVVPLNIADGCLYRCKFCSVKSGTVFSTRKRENIEKQLHELKHFYGPNIQNFNALFIGGHDGLAAGTELIDFTVRKAFNTFQFDQYRDDQPSIYLFGSASSFLRTDESGFGHLNELPCKTYINLGLEAFDALTLQQLGKPITPEMVKQSLQKMIDVNAHFTNIEVSANFLLGTTFSAAHHEAMIENLSQLSEGSCKRGCIYLSPLVETQHREDVLPMFHMIKEKSVLPTYIYLIQRL